ncbi:MAG: valine--tRNA ligase [Spirochaetota bacterium]|nr:MAG: valine--tRNA ligase [Spirochaetota bacterium]
MRKAMELEKRYNPEHVESKWYRFWEKEGFFHSEIDNTRAPYTIVIPPPNVTGALHMGHGLNNTIQDILIRWRRMQGINTLWVPGTDHAGIATQNVVERQIATQGRTRQEVGRQKFIELVWKWREQYGGRIIDQLKRLGASCDWERERFTMDEGLSRAVREVFVRLYNEGLIYRGKYIINWCPRCQTALSDEEVEHKAQQGFLYYVKYPLKNKDGNLVVATTRPETMLGDTAVAVNPDDKRYNKFIGKTAILPLVGRELPVIADRYVDMEFGTGALKITPAHDPNDFEIGIRHNLPCVNILHEDATINENGIADCIGMDRYEAREVVVEELKKKGNYVKQEPYTHEIGHCYRCHTVIEPYLSEQWFVKMKPLAEQAIRVVKEGEIRFYPKRWEKVYMNWMENIKDWCISRQIWWGHRIPVYYCRECSEMFASVDEPSGCRSCSSSKIYQDEDVLDTWFSSQLWPFSTLGWPELTDELGYYYPTAVLITDPGILFFWVARMIMSGLKFMEDIPFRDVYIHGVVMDAEGRKMSKSLGNGIDPLEVVEQYGADAMRYTIVNITPFGQNLLLSMDKFNTGARFANKIWNASRYILMNIEGIELCDVKEQDLDTTDRWILTLFEWVVRDVNRYLDEYKLNDASSLIYEFFWHEFCDWYIEMSKLKLYSDDKRKQSHAASMLIRILDGCMRLLHPIMPFITEEIWQRLPLKRENKSIMIASYPVCQEDHVYAKSIKPVEILKEITYNVRNIRGELHVPPELMADVLVKTADNMVGRVIEEHGEVIRFLARLKKIDVGRDLEKPPGSASSVGNGYEVYLPLVGLIDIDRERLRLQKELEKLTVEIERSERKLNKAEFIKKAPQSVVEREKERLESHKEAHERVNGILESLN